MANKQWIEDALEAINEMREFHQADALEWSDECYQEALKQAEACSKSSKLAGGNNSGKSGPHGQILYAGEGGGKADIPGATQEWYEASSKYDFFKAVGGKESDDFTQLVWKDTKHVGMAISACGKFIVANFLPAGNVKGAFAKNVLLPEFEADKEVEDLGMIFNSFPPMPLIVKEVAEDSWADSVDISEGDRFYSINGKKVEGMPTDEYKELIQKRPLRLKLLMGTSLAEEPKEEDKKKEKAAKIARRGSVGRGKSELIAEKGVDKIGMILSLPPKALEVRKVTPGGWADTKGIEPGDIFMEVNGKPVAELTPEQFKEAMMNRPIKFKLATLEEQKAAVILQRVARKSLAARLAQVSEWRGDISRKAKQDSEDDKDELAASGRTREELIKAVFDACKPNKDGNLQQKELLRFARHIDFPGTDEDWEIEYGELCKEYKWDKAEGIDFEDFQDLVDEEKGNPYYCGNDRLDGVLIRIDQNEAATKIQASFKGRSVRKKQAERFNRKKGTDEEEKAATKIQSVRRGKKAREEVKKKKAEKDGKTGDKKDNKKDDAKDGGKKVDPKEQKKFQDKDYSKEEEKAAVKIQSVQRGKKAREEVQKKKDEKDGKNAGKKDNKKDDAKDGAKKIDPKEQKKLQEKDYSKEEEKAAVKIQSIQRGKKAREEVQKKKDEKDGKNGDKAPVAKAGAKKAVDKKAVDKKDDKKTAGKKDGDKKDDKSDQDKKEEEKAATKIQSIQRGKKARAEVEKKKEAKDAKKGDTKDDKKESAKEGAKKSDSKDKKEETKKSKEEEEEEKAATKIQSIQRGKKAREEVNKKKDEKGGNKAKDETKKTKDEKAAKKGDKEEKGNKSQEGEDEKKKEEEEKAATKIQSIQRGKKARAEVEKKKKEAKEEGGNKAKETKKSKEEKAGAEKPQKGDKEQKGKKAEEEEEKKKKNNEKEQSEEEKAATKIQSMHRGKKAREEVKKKKEDKEKGKEKSETAKQPSKDEKGKQKSQTPKELTKEEKEQEEAAKKIQSVHRGKKAREEVQKMKEDQAGGKTPATMGKIKSGATFSSAAAQRDQERMEREASRKERQARKEKPPNAKAKPKNQTKEEAEQEAAAISIQNRVRQRQAKKKVDEKRMEKAREEGKRLGQAKFASETPAPKAPKAPKKPLNQEEAAAKIQARQRGKMQRKDLERRKQEFSKLDRDNDGYLNELEMKNFACLLGYSGSDREWRQEYDALCYQFRWDSRVGLSERDFIWLTTNPKEQYWFDAKRLDQGWEVAAEMPEDADLVETLLPSQLGPGGQQIPSGAVMREQLRSSVEVPIVAEVAGLDWEKLISNDDLKDKLQQNISRILNKKTGISMSDLKVTLSSASRAMPGRA